METSQNYISEKVKDSDNNTINPATIESINALSLILDSLQFWLQTDKSKTLRVQLDPQITSNVNITGWTIWNIARQGDLQLQRINEAIMDAAYINWIYNHLTF